MLTLLKSSPAPSNSLATFSCNRPFLGTAIRMLSGGNRAPDVDKEAILLYFSSFFENLWIDRLEQERESWCVREDDGWWCAMINFSLISIPFLLFPCVIHESIKVISNGRKTKRIYEGSSTNFADRQITWAYDLSNGRNDEAWPRSTQKTSGSASPRGRGHGMIDGKGLDYLALTSQWKHYR